jgi:hypothetical protein
VSDTLARIIVGAIVLVFIGNFLASVVIPGYTPDPTIGPIMGTIAGGALAYYAAKRNGKNGNGAH